MHAADNLARWLEGKDMQHMHGAPYHPQTQGKIERWHQTLKNRILLDNYYLPGDLERQIAAHRATLMSTPPALIAAKRSSSKRRVVSGVHWPGVE
jgi:transposase InsO family protein